MGYQYIISYNGKIYNKSQILKELGISAGTWSKCTRRVFYRLEKQGIDYRSLSGNEFYSLVIDEVKRIKSAILVNAENKEKEVETLNKKLDRPVTIKNKVFYTFGDIQEYLGYNDFNYKGYLNFKSSRKTAYSVEDYIAYLYREDEQFKLRLLYITEVIDENLYRLASRCMKEYYTDNKEYWSDGEKLKHLSAEDAIKLAYGKMNFDASKFQITSILTNRWVNNQYMRGINNE